MRYGVVLVVVIGLILPLVAEGKKLRPKYYKACYADYKEMRKAIPKPPVDLKKTAKTVNAVASLAGSFGGFGGLGSAASTASQVASYSSTIVDIIEFTETMKQSFPKAPDRYKAYGDRMNQEASEIQSVADFSMNSQDCYANAYMDLRNQAPQMKPKEVKKRLKEIEIGTENVGELLDHAVKYMDTNISAYNEALTTDTSENGLNLGNLLALANQAGAIKQKVDLASGDYESAWAGSGWTRSQINLEAHRQAMTAHYSAAGMSDVYQVPTATDAASLFGNLSTLTNIVNLGEVDPGLALQMALSQGAGIAATADSSQAPVPAAMQQAASAETEVNIDALREAGGEIEPYLEAYNRIKSLSQMQTGVQQFVTTSF